MKKNYIPRFTAAVLFCFFLPALLFAQKKNYISIEGGTFYGGAENDIKSQMVSSGFGDRLTYDLYYINLFLSLFTFGGNPSINLSTSEQYPKSSTGKGKFWFRYGRELKNGKTIELSYGKIHNSTVEGIDVTAGTGEDADGNRLVYAANISAFTAHYILSNKKRSLGMGIGPALAFDKITREANEITDSKNVLQPGISGTAYWRFVNGKVFFMALRTDAMIFIPATIEEVTLTSPKGNQSTFHTTKINTFTGDVTVSVGIKF